MNHLASSRGRLVSCALVAAIACSAAPTADAAPPPPPKEADLKSLQSYILGLDQGRPEAYQSALADDLQVTVGGNSVARSKSDWMKSEFARFTRGYNENVTVERVFYGGSFATDGGYANEAILMERANRIFGDCCVYYRFETLTFRKDGLIDRIDRSAELDLELKPDGRRQDGLPGTP